MSKVYTEHEIHLKRCTCGEIIPLGENQCKMCVQSKNELSTLPAKKERRKRSKMFFPKSKGINGGNKIVAMGRKTMYAKIDNSVYHCNPTQEMIDVYLTLATTSINVNDLNDLSLKVKKLDLSRRIGITK